MRTQLLSRREKISITFGHRSIPAGYVALPAAYRRVRLSRAPCRQGASAPSCDTLIFSRLLRLRVDQTTESVVASQMASCEEIWRRSTTSYHLLSAAQVFVISQGFGDHGPASA